MTYTDTIIDALIECYYADETGNNIDKVDKALDLFQDFKSAIYLLADDYSKEVMEFSERILSLEVPND